MATTGDNPFSSATSQTGKSQTVTKEAQIIPTTSTTSETSGEKVTTMSPEALAALQNLIGTLSSGGTAQQRAEIARKKQTQELIQGLLGNYTSGKAFEEAKGLMALNMQQAMEKNRPAIQRAIEGAGTSAASMQGLLAQQLARDSSLAASAFGGEQAKVYAGTTANLAGSLANMASTAMDPVTDALLKSLQVAKDTQRTTSGSRTTVTQGQTVVPGARETTVFNTPSYDYGGGTNPTTETLKDIGFNFSGPTTAESAMVNRAKKAPGVYSTEAGMSGEEIMAQLQASGQGMNFDALQQYADAGYFRQ